MKSTMFDQATLPSKSHCCIIEYLCDHLESQANPLDSIRLKARNISPTQEDGNYGLVYTNPSDNSGLKLRISPFSELELGYGDHDLVIEAERGPYLYSHPDISFSLVSLCEDELAGGDGLSQDPLKSEMSVSLKWIEPCGSVEWAGDLAQSGFWRVLQNSG